MAGQPPLLKPDHVPVKPSRKRLRKHKDDHGITVVNPERIYLAEWKRKQRQFNPGGVGWTLLEKILYVDQGGPPVSRRDAAVVATFVQWLGTNIGLGFILEAERKIDILREKNLTERLSVTKFKSDQLAKTMRRILDQAEATRIITFDDD